MAAISKKLRTAVGNGLVFMCPGCNERHVIYHGDGNGPRWSWIGDATAPTFTPSVRVRGVKEDTGVPSVCHSVITKGKIQFLGDCTHNLAGQTVDLPDWTDFDDAELSE